MTEQATSTERQGPSAERQNHCIYPYGPHKDRKALLKRLASSPLSVLLTGESGTGKEVMARRLHTLSGRTGAFVGVNCGALASSLIASELFGHVKGAFTGAVGQRVGYIEQAHGGTLFLDEITEMPIEAQTTLLRALQEREVTRLGSSRATPVDIRVISATNRDPVQAITDGKLREDIYFRLKDVQLGMPPLRARPQEIVPLARFFTEKAAEELGDAKAELTPDAEALLERRSWEGNIRQLRAEIRVAFHLNAVPGETCRISSDMLDEVASLSGAEAAPRPPARATLQDDDIVLALARRTVPQIKVLTKMGIAAAAQRALNETDGPVAEALAQIGLDVNKFYRIVREMGLTPRQFRGAALGEVAEQAASEAPPPSSRPAPR